MSAQDFAYLIPYLLSAGTSAAIGIYAWGKSVAGSRQFALLAIAQATATLGFVLELLSPTLEGKLFWTNIQTIAFFAWPVAYLAFALSYSGREMPGGRRSWALLISPFLIFLVLLFTDPLHGLVRPDVRLEPGEPFPALLITFTVPIYLAAIYSYSFIIAALYLLGKKYMRPSPLYRGQVGTVIVGTMIPVVVGVLTASGVRVGFQSDPTPLTFALGNLVVAWGLYRYRLFDLVPVARDSIVESMGTGVIVIDLQGRIVDLNPAANDLLGGGTAAWAGQSATTALSEWPQLARAVESARPQRFELRVGEGKSHIDLGVGLELVDERRGQPGGLMLLLRDITKHKDLMTALQENQDLLEARVEQRTAAIAAAGEKLHLEAEERQRAERALRRSERQLTQFLDALPMGVVVHGPDTKPRYVNHYALEMLGISMDGAQQIDPDEASTLEEAIQQFPIYHAGEDQKYPPERSPIVRALNGERARTDDIELSLNGNRVPLEVLASPIYDENGEVQYAVTAFQDISERKRLEEALEAIYRMGRELALIRDEEAIARSVVEHAHHLLDIEMAGFALVDEPACELVYRYSILGADEQVELLRLPLDGKASKSISAAVFSTGEPMNVPDIREEPLYYLETQDWDGRSELCVPIRVGDRILGVLNAESRQLNRFGRRDERLLQALADQCGVAVENARLYGQIAQRLKEQTALQQAISSISSTLELEVVLFEIAQQLGQAVDATSAYIISYDEDAQTIAVIADYMGPEANDKERVPDLGVTYSVLDEFPSTVRDVQRGKPHVTYLDDPDLPATEREHFLRYGARTALFIPMWFPGKTNAHAEIWDSRTNREFSFQEIELCKGIAQQAAIAMENARLYAQAQEELIERRRIEEQLEKHQEELEVLVMDRTSELSEASDRLATLNDASRVLSAASLDSEQVYEAIHKAVSWLMPAEVFSITLFDQATGQAEDIYRANETGRQEDRQYALDKTFADYMLQLGESLRVEDVELFSERITPMKDYFEPNTRSSLAVLLPGTKRYAGLLLAQCNECAAYSEEDVKILEMLAAHAATAMENAQLYQAAQRVAADEERQRLARQLHDSVTQSLYSLTLMTNGWAAMSAQGELEDPAASFRQLEELGIQTLREMRLLIHQLRPPVLEETGLVGAIQERLETVEHRVGVQTELTANGKVEDIPIHVEEELFHITQEALNNTLRHAEASFISVRIVVDKEVASLEVEDDGQGFVATTVNGGMGLVSMRERAEGLGADLLLRSNPGEGTLVGLTVPIG